MTYQVQDRDTAWKVLQASAFKYAETKSKEAAAALSQASYDWAAANGKGATSSAPAARAASSGRSTGVTLPFGRAKGKDVADAKDDDLEWMAGAVAKSIDDPAKSRWVEQNQALLDAIQGELAARRGATREPGDDVEPF